MVKDKTNQELNDLGQRLSWLSADVRTIVISRRCGVSKLLRPIGEADFVAECREVANLLFELAGAPATVAGPPPDSEVTDNQGELKDTVALAHDLRGREFPADPTAEKDRTRPPEQVGACAG